MSANLSVDYDPKILAKEKRGASYLFLQISCTVPSVRVIVNLSEFVFNG